jgi:phospholipase/lecithinase/hemolysin
MRMRGLVPAAVSVSCDPLQTDVWRHWPAYTDTPQIEIQAGDNPAHADLRWVVHLPLVWLSGADAARVQAVMEALLAAGAQRVVAMVFADRRRGPTMVSMRDSAEVMTWQA